MQKVDLRQVVSDALDDGKARDVTWLDVTNQTDITDFMVVVSGTSTTHVRAVVRRVVDAAGNSGLKPLGVEGLEDAEWVLIDLADIVIHVMLPKAREFYDLERLWSVGSTRTESSL